MNPHHESLPEELPEAGVPGLNPEDEAFLQQLRGLSPAAPSADWMRQAISRAPAPRRVIPLFWIAAAAAACVAAGLWIGLTHATGRRSTVRPETIPDEIAAIEPGAVRLRPVSLTRTPELLEDQGLLTAGDQVWQRFRSVQMEESSWQATEGDRRVQLRVPREELILLPVATY